MLRLRTLGGLSLEREGEPVPGAAAQRKPLVLLAVLATAGEAGMSRDKILAYLWPESAPDKAGHNLRQLLHVLRRDVQVEALFLGSTELRLNPQVISSDVREFTEALDAGDLERGVSLYAGAFLEGFHPGGSFELEQWIELERDRLAKRVLRALESLAAAAGERGDSSAAVEWWRRLVEADPFNSRVTIGYMRALSAAGDRAGALQIARVHQTRLREELDAEPDREVEAAAERIRRPGADPSAAPQPTARLEPSIPALHERPFDAYVAATARASIAVLPFVNLSADPDDEYFSDGMTDELRNALCRLRGLRVAARTSAFAFKNQNVDVRRIGERLNVAALVEGSVRKAGDRVRISAQLVGVADGYQLWSETYERTLEDVFAVQEELARSIAAALSPRLAGEAGGPLIAPGTDRMEAYTLYFRGRYRLNKRTLEDLRAALGFFEAALAADPAYALPHAGLAEAHAMLGFAIYGDTPPREAMPKAKDSARQALAIDSDLADAHGWLAVAAFLYDWDWAAAEEGFQRALTLDSRAPFVHFWHALFLAAMGRHSESLQAAASAQALDPLSIVAAITIGRCYFLARRYEEALRHLRAALEMEPRNVQAHELIAWTLCSANRVPEARLELEKSMERVGRTPGLLAMYGRTCAASGMRRQAMEVLEWLKEEAGKGRYLTVFCEIQVLLGLGDLESLFRAYDRGLAERAGYVPFLATTPLNDPVRSDPRFIALLERLQLPVTTALPRRSRLAPPPNGPAPPTASASAS